MAKEKDIIMKKFMGNDDVFSDAVNYCIFGGRQEVMPENLKELNTEESLLVTDAILYNKVSGVQKNIMQCL